MGEERDPAELGLAYGRALAEELCALVGVELSVKGPSIEYLDRASALDCKTPIGHTRCTSGSNSEQKLHLVMPSAEAITLAALMMGQDEQSVKEAREASLEGDILETYVEIMNLAVSVLGRVFSEDFGLPSLDNEVTQEVASPSDETEAIEGDEFLVARYRLIISGFDNGRMDILFALDVAEQWFGTQSAAGAAGTESCGEEADSASTADIAEEIESVAVIDPILEERQKAEELEEDLDFSILALDPQDVDPEDFDELAEAGAYFVEWDLGVRSGLEVLEALRADERTLGKPIVMASAAPTASMVKTALAAGADGFIHKPYRADELKARLTRLPIASPDYS